jgi:CRISPR/Cas system CMR-associated protein Cmr5 small subunit
MWDDPIVQEIRKVREEHAARLRFNLQAIADDLKKQQENSGKKFVSLASKKPTIFPRLDSKKDAK